MDDKIEWLKNRGYLHLSTKLNINKDRNKILSKALNPNFVAKYAFLPLIHASIKERRFKKINGARAHSFLDENGKIKLNAKTRPLHYSSHMDSIIFGYYSAQLSDLYESELKKQDSLNDCVIAYRKIPIDGTDKNKSTIHFANEAFLEIKRRAEIETCSVLKFDIESYFSTIDHKILKKAWASLLNMKSLPPDHFNVFKAATKFCYILKDDLRVNERRRNKRGSHFNEKHIASIRKKGISSFLESPQAFRQAIKDGDLTLHKYPFRNKEHIPRGIPQGLPLSATLANLYLLSFDKKIIQKIVNEHNGYYRRYSDDMIVVCKPEDASLIESFVKKSIEENKIALSDSKTEKFLFKKNSTGKIVSIKLDISRSTIGTPFTYLGFEFYGYKSLIKSANLAKFYRRLVYAVKRKIKRAATLAQSRFDRKIVVYRRQLYKLYTALPLTASRVRTRTKWLSKNERGEYFFRTKEIDKKFNSNYISYVHRASKIMNEPAITKQIKKHSRIFNQAIFKHSQKAQEKLSAHQ